MKAIALLQARTNSSRLPGKILLPVCGIPIVVLAAKRAANKQRPVIVATSTEPSDDLLVSVLKQHEIEVFRGSLENTLGRFIGAIGDCDDETPVIRLTADNLLPDGEFLDAIEADFIARDLQYLSCNSKSGLPYGVSAEIIRAGALRAAASSTDAPYDLEHVTPWVVRKYGMETYRPEQDVSMRNYRCTVDTLDDYLHVAKIFSDTQDPVSEPMSQLLEVMRGMDERPRTNIDMSKFVLGTAQMGLDYGINNATGQPSISAARHILRTAITNGVAQLDTARAYGTSETVVGNALDNGWKSRCKVITKIDPLESCSADTPPNIVKRFVDASVFQSCRELKVQRLDTVLLHRAAHRTNWDGAAWHQLQKLQREGVIESLGVSLQNPVELIDALTDNSVDHIQMPYNLCDWRWKDAIAELKGVKRSRGLTVHTRSAFLQGLLLSRDNNHWKRAGADNGSEMIAWLDQQVKLLERHDLADLCLAYVNAQDWIDGIVMGVETIDQLFANFTAFSSPQLSQQQVEEMEQSRPKMSEKLLDPSQWQST